MLDHQSSVNAQSSFVVENAGLTHLARLFPVEDVRVGTATEAWHLEVGGFQDLYTRMARMLSRTERGHVVVTGAPGVGKTSFVRGFAQFLGRGKAAFLDAHAFLRFDVSNVGPEDSRACLETIFSAISEVPHCLLCLDGLAQLMKRAQGGTNTPLLRTLLARSGVKIIGVMSDWEYAEHLGNDARMLQLFERIGIDEPQGDRLTQIVWPAIEGMQQEFDIQLSPHLVERTIALTSTFLLSESEPARSIRLLRELCEERQFDRQEGLATCNAMEESDLVEAVARRTGIPEVTVSGQGQNCHYAAALEAAVVGQEEAVREVARELELISAGLTEPNKPASVLMFAGMTGVGKTELAKRIAQLYSTSRRVHVYSMGNFTESHSVSGINGVPPGYVGHEDGGRLINELRADPYSVFLLDEAEKCHPNVWKPFLNLFDEGWIVDQRGVKAYADRAIFILTTNAGDRNISQLVRSGKPPEEVAHQVRLALSRVRQERSSQPVFPPQFLSRMKRIIVFRPLDESAMRGITHCVSRHLAERWQHRRQKRLVIAPEVIDQIARRAHLLNERSQGQEGGRIVHKLLRDHVEYVVYERSLNRRALYEATREIHVHSAAETPENEQFITEVEFR